MNEYKNTGINTWVNPEPRPEPKAKENPGAWKKKPKTGKPKTSR